MDWVKVSFILVTWVPCMGMKSYSHINAMGDLILIGNYAIINLYFIVTFYVKVMDMKGL